MTRYFCTSTKCSKPPNFRPVEKMFSNKDRKCVDCGQTLIITNKSLRRKVTPKSARPGMIKGRLV